MIADLIMDGFGYVVREGMTAIELCIVTVAAVVIGRIK